MVREHLHFQKGALGIEGDEQIDRYARKAGQGDEINRLKDISHELIGGGVLFEDGPDGQLGILLSHHQRRRECFSERLRRHHASLRARQKRAKQQPGGTQRAHLGLDEFHAVLGKYRCHFTRLDQIIEGGL